MPGVALIWDLIAVDRTTGPMTRAAASMDRTAAAATKMETSMSRMNRMIGISAKALGALGAVDFAAHAVKDAAQFQKSMTLIQTQAGASAKQVQKFSGQILNLSGKVAQAPEDLSTSLYHVYSALNKVGATAPQMMKTVKIAAEGAKVGMASVEDTTNSLTATLASGIVRFNQAGKAMGALNAIVGAGDMHFQDLNDALGTGLLVTMKAFGVSLTDTGAALAVFGDNNIRGADAATKLRMSVQDLAKPSANAAAVLAKVHLTTEQLRKTLQENGLNAALHLLTDRMTAAGITGSKVGGFLEDAFTKKAGTGLAILTQRMHQFDEARAQVQKGAGGFGSAWQAVTKTASFQLDRLGSMMQSWAIEIGTKMLPAVTNAAQWLGEHLPKALHELGAILGPTIHNIGAGLAGAFRVLLDVMRPIASMFSGIAHFLETNKTLASGLATSVIALWVAFKGAGIVLRLIAGFGPALRNISSGAGQASRSLGGMSAAQFALNGAVAVGTIAVTAAIMQWQRRKQIAAEAAAEEKANVDALTQAIQQDSGALGKNTIEWIRQKLAADGVYDLTSKLGLSYEQMTKAALDNKTAVQQLHTSLSGLSNNDKMRVFIQGNAAELLNLGNETSAAAKHAHEMAVEAKQEAAAHRLAALAAAGGAHSVQYLDGALKEGATSFVAASKATKAHADATQTDTTKTDQLRNATDQLKGALKGVAGALNNAAAAVAWQQSLNDLTQTFKDNKGAIDGHTNAALADRAALIGDMQTVVQHAQTMSKNGASWQKVTGYIATQYSELRQHAIAGKADGAQIDALAKKLGLFPKSIKSRIDINVQDALNKLAEVQVAIHNLGNGNYRLASNGAATGASLGLAAGGIVHGPGTGTSDTAGVYALSRGEAVIPAKAVSRHIGLIRSLIAAGRGLAQGGLMGYVTRAGFRGQSARIMDAVAMAESGGDAHAHNYNPSTRDDSYGLAQINLYGSLRSRLQQFHLGSPSALYNPATNLRVAYALSGGGRDFSPWTTYTSGAYRQFLGGSGSLSNAGGGRSGSASSKQSHLSSTAASAIGKIGAAAGGGNKFSVADVGISRIRSQIAHAWDVLNSEIGKGLSSAAAAKFKKELEGYTKLAARELARLKHTIMGRDENSLTRAGVSGSHSDVVTAFGQMLKDAKNAGATARQINNLTQAEKGLLAMQSQRVKDQAVLARMQQKSSNMVNYRQGITGTLRGAFDSTTYGSIQDLTAGFASATKTNRTYTHELSYLSKRIRGNSVGAKALRAYVTQLQASGQTTTLATLAGASDRQLGQLEKSLLSYNSSVSAGGDQAVLGKYGLSIAAQGKRVSGEKDKIDDLRADVRKLVAVMGHVATRDIKLHINGHEIAADVVKDPAMERLLHQLSDAVGYRRKK